MNKRRGNPDREARTKHNPQQKMLVETSKGHGKKQDARHNSSQRAFGIIDHEGKIVGILTVQPKKNNQPRQRHYGD